MISREELRDAVMALNTKMTEKDVEALMKKCDKDNDGNIDIAGK